MPMVPNGSISTEKASVAGLCQAIDSLKGARESQVSCNDVFTQLQ
jgi:hypothetical protein